MGNKSAKLTTSVEQQLGKSIKELQKLYEENTIRWYRESYINKGGKITLDGGGNIKNGGHSINALHGIEPEKGYYNKHNYKLVIMYDDYDNDNNNKTVILGVKSIKELIDAGKITNTDIPISAELYNRIQAGLATPDELVPTIKQIATIELKKEKEICKHNPGDCKNMQGGNRKKSKKTRKISRNKRK